jgi:FMN phosphatase YigB (HAD superfamily)
MNLTLLLDLDNTLLDSSMDTFLPAYFQAFSGFLSEWVDPELMLSSLKLGTRAMILNTDPSRTLKQVFDDVFFPRVGLTKEELGPRIDRFYEEVFPGLSYLTGLRPQAIDLVAWAREQGARLAVATNPLFPLAAIHQRMRWAGLPPEQASFSVVAAYESFHFAKPRPAYFAELLGRLAWPEGAVVMVGDDTENDLPGSKILGLPTFWICAPDGRLPSGTDLAGQGSIGDVRPWLESTDLSALEPDFSRPESLIAILLSTPAAIYGLLDSSLKGEQYASPVLKQRPVENEWSLTEIFCHLRDTELEINLPRLRMLLELEEPFIPTRDTDSWAVKRGYQNQDALQALLAFATARVHTAELLRGLKGEWKRKARHAIFGPTDLQELVKFMAEHDKLHIRQIQSNLEDHTK